MDDRLVSRGQAMRARYTAIKPRANKPPRAQMMTNRDFEFMMQANLYHRHDRVGSSTFAFLMRSSLSWGTSFSITPSSSRSPIPARTMRSNRPTNFALVPCPCNQTGLTVCYHQLPLSVRYGSLSACGSRLRTNLSRRRAKLSRLSEKISRRSAPVGRRSTETGRLSAHTGRRST